MAVACDCASRAGCGVGAGVALGCGSAPGKPRVAEASSKVVPTCVVRPLNFSRFIQPTTAKPTISANPKMFLMTFLYQDREFPPTPKNGLRDDLSIDAQPKEMPAGPGRDRLRHRHR